MLKSNACVEQIKVGDSFLEKAPGVDVTKDTIFNSADYSRRFLWNTYRQMYFGLPVGWGTIPGKMNMNIFESLSDCWQSHMTWDEVSRTYYAGGYNAGMEDWSGHTRFGFNKEGTWEAIRSGWLFIENVDQVLDMTDEEKLRLKAEAKVIICTRYFDMYRHFGGLPIVDHAIEVNNTDLDKPRATIIETNDFMIKLLDEAIPNLPWALDADEYENWDGRLTKAAAMALKCKILLFTASPLFNSDEPYCTEEPQDAVENRQVWIGSYDESLWDDCLQACKDFFAAVEENGIYHLVEPIGTTQDDYREAYRTAYSTRGSGYDNPEMLISTRYNYNNYGYFRNGSCPRGAFTPTEEFMEMFPMADGTPFDWNNSDDVKNIFSDRDPRLYETMVVNGATYKGHKAEMWVVGLEMQKNSVTESGQFASGFGNYKYILDYTSSAGKPALWPYLRMAEVYLIYAEALTKKGQYIDAIAQVDKVRTRVGLKGLVESNPGIDLQNETNLMKEILRERACELGLEDVRLFDICRNKMAANFTTPLHGLRTYRADGVQDSWSNKPEDSRGEYPTEFTYEKFQLNSRYLWGEGNWSPKWYLTAFPPSEVNKDYGLTQNPGW